MIIYFFILCFDLDTLRLQPHFFAKCIRTRITDLSRRMDDHFRQMTCRCPRGCTIPPPTSCPPPLPIPPREWRRASEPPSLNPAPPVHGVGRTVRAAESIRDEAKCCVGKAIDTK